MNREQELTKKEEREFLALTEGQQQIFLDFLLERKMNFNDYLASHPREKVIILNEFIKRVRIERLLLMAHKAEM